LMLGVTVLALLTARGLPGRARQIAN